MARILVVDDNAELSDALREGFEFEGYSVTAAADGESGFRKARGGRFDLMLLDVALPRMTGLDVLKQLRAEGDDTPVIMLTARDHEIERVMGLRLGADDYLTKPFSFLELLARVEAVLRRAARPVHGVAFGLIEVGNLALDLKKREATKGGRTIELSAREFDLLAYLAQRPGEVVTRERLLETVWDYEKDLQTRTVDVHIGKLRKKIEDDPADPRHLLTVHGVGYKFTA